MNARRTILTAAFRIQAAICARAANEHSVQGILLQVDRQKGPITVSCDASPVAWLMKILRADCRPPRSAHPAGRPPETARFARPLDARSTRPSSSPAWRTCWDARSHVALQAADRQSNSQKIIS